MRKAVLRRAFIAIQEQEKSQTHHLNLTPKGTRKKQSKPKVSRR